LKPESEELCADSYGLTLALGCYCLLLLLLLHVLPVVCCFLGIALLHDCISFMSSEL
jgi:hypothetical protein